MTPELERFYKCLKKNKESLIPEKHYKEILTKKGEPGKTSTLGLTDKETVEAFKKSQSKYIEVKSAFDSISNHPELNDSLKPQMKLLRGLLFDLERRLRIKRQGVTHFQYIPVDLAELIENDPDMFKKTVFKTIQSEFDEDLGKEVELAKKHFKKLEPFIERRNFWKDANSLHRSYQNWKNNTSKL